MHERIPPYFSSRSPFPSALRGSARRLFSLLRTWPQFPIHEMSEKKEKMWRDVFFPSFVFRVNGCRLFRDFPPPFLLDDILIPSPSLPKNNGWLIAAISSFPKNRYLRQFISHKKQKGKGGGCFQTMRCHIWADLRGATEWKMGFPPPPPIRAFECVCLSQSEEWHQKTPKTPPVYQGNNGLSLDAGKS